MHFWLLSIVFVTKITTLKLLNHISKYFSFYACVSNLIDFFYIIDVFLYSVDLNHKMFV